ncbi:phytochelatin synthase family protein [Paraburkholderia bryophila]|uniref:phytochelatin synthase family protein n=1 Tax=Burkholderiaceae TaxID=119060 RepID=UPI0005500EC1|nr:phytochelatin synthase family protein [Burkholderia sp. 9120]
MSRYSLKRTVGRAGRPAWIAALLMTAALAACAPAPVATSQTASETASQTANPVAIQTATQKPVAQPSAQTPPINAKSADGPLPVPPNLVALAQPAGQKRLIGAAANQSYWPLSQYFETQRNEAYCSVATSVMALNALGIRRPASTLYPDFPYFSQEDFFRGVDPQVANAARVSHEGMTLDQLGAALQAFPVAVQPYHAADLTLAQFRDLIRETTRHGDRFALLNFRRVEIGETGGGHWSPLAAYDAASDSALLLDVARYKYPAVWVPVAQLYAAALAVDNVSGLSRGVVVIGRRQG